MSALAKRVTREESQQEGESHAFQVGFGLRNRLRVTHDVAGNLHETG